MDRNKKFKKPHVRLPTLLLIGAQKAGTSAVADWLFDCGDFRRPLVMEKEPDYYSKEVHFFDLNHRYNQGINFYAKRFQYCKEPREEHRTLDATPDTLSFADRVKSMYDAAGGNQSNTVKMLVILRDPVARELSLYNHLAFDCRRLAPSERNSWHRQVIGKDGVSIMSFDEFVEELSIPALDRTIGIGRSTRHSLYAEHLSKWFQHFDRQQMLVLSYSELQNDTKAFQRRIEEFLGFRIPGDLKVSNSNASPHKISNPLQKTREKLEAAFARANEQLYQLLNRNPGPPMEESPFPPFNYKVSRDRKRPPGDAPRDLDKTSKKKKCL